MNQSPGQSIDAYIPARIQGIAFFVVCSLAFAGLAAFDVLKGRSFFLLVGLIVVIGLLSELVTFIFAKRVRIDSSGLLVGTGSSAESLPWYLFAREPALRKNASYTFSKSTVLRYKDAANPDGKKRSRGTVEIAVIRGADEFHEKIRSLQGRAISKAEVDRYPVTIMSTGNHFKARALLILSMMIFIGFTETHDLWRMFALEAAFFAVMLYFLAKKRIHSGPRVVVYRDRITLSCLGEPFSIFFNNIDDVSLREGDSGDDDSGMHHLVLTLRLPVQPAVQPVQWTVKNAYTVEVDLLDFTMDPHEFAGLLRQHLAKAS